MLGAGLIGDFNPHHVDESYAKGTRFGTRILHGMLTGAIMGAPLGMYFHGTAIGFLEHNVRFIAPVRAGDTLTTTLDDRGEARQAEACGRHRRCSTANAATRTASSWRSRNRRCWQAIARRDRAEVCHLTERCG